MSLRRRRPTKTQLAALTLVTILSFGPIVALLAVIGRDSGPVASLSTGRTPPDDGAKVDVSFTAVSPSTGTMTALVQVEPFPGLLDEQGLTDELVMRVNDARGDTSIVFPAGEPLRAVTVTLPLSGRSISRYPFDRYRSAVLMRLEHPTGAETEPEPVRFTVDVSSQLADFDVGLDDFTFDTDWFPMDAPLQLRLIAHGGNSVQISMPGQGRYDWDSETLDFLGDAEAGHLGVDIGLTLDAKIRFDVLGLQWESDILGPYDYAVIAEDGFTPYLLPGNPERPVSIDDETDPVTFVSVPVTPDIIVAAGNLDIDAYVIVAASLVGDSIEATTLEPAPQLATVLAEGLEVDAVCHPGLALEHVVLRADRGIGGEQRRVVCRVASSDQRPVERQRQPGVRLATSRIVAHLVVEQLVPRQRGHPCGHLGIGRPARLHPLDELGRYVGEQVGERPEADRLLGDPLAPLPALARVEVVAAQLDGVAGVDDGPRLGALVRAQGRERGGGAREGAGEAGRRRRGLAGADPRGGERHVLDAGLGGAELGVRRVVVERGFGLGLELPRGGEGVGGGGLDRQEVGLGELAGLLGGGFGLRGLAARVGFGGRGAARGQPPQTEMQEEVALGGHGGGKHSPGPCGRGISGRRAGAAVTSARRSYDKWRVATHRVVEGEARRPSV